jgi:hypothetical protein
MLVTQAYRFELDPNKEYGSALASHARRPVCLRLGPGPGEQPPGGPPGVGSLTCAGTREVGYFWSQVLAWPLVWDCDEETAIRALDGAGQFVTWGCRRCRPSGRRTGCTSMSRRHRAATGESKSSDSSRWAPASLTSDRATCRGS